MGEIRINIPDGMDAKLEAAFPGEDKAAVLLRLAEAAMLHVQATPASPTGAPKKSLVEQFAELRQGMPSISQDEIRRIREDLRQ